MSAGPDPLRILGGVLLLLFGICLLLAGGICTFFMLGDLRTALAGGGPLFFISVGTLALGVLSILAGIKSFLTPRDR